MSASSSHRGHSRESGPDHQPSCAEGVVDLQLNGFAGVDFNADNLTDEQLHTVCERLRAEGVAAFLPTIITADLDDMIARLTRLVRLRNASPLTTEMLWGIHIEGPFISAASGFVGAHPVAHVRPPNLDEAQRLLAAADGLTRIVTLAPELDQGLHVTRWLAEQGVIVAAGHCDPSREQLIAAIDAGLRMFTHLGNGCPHTLPRHDNIIERVLSLSDQLWISFIGDGLHVPFPALGNYLRAAGIQRCVMVSDAVHAAGLGPGRYTVADQTVEVGEDGVPRAVDGLHFAGSATSLPQMAERLRHQMQLSAEAVVQLTSVGPRQLLQDHRETAISASP